MSINKKLINIFMAMLLMVIIAISSSLLLRQKLEEEKQSNEFKELEEIVTIANEDTQEIKELHKESEDKHNSKAVPSQNIDLQKLYNMNSDLVGWIEIDGTNINYPVMQKQELLFKKGLLQRIFKLWNAILSGILQYKN